MPKEIERKFLVNEDEYHNYLINVGLSSMEVLIKQGYIFLNKDKHLRVRVFESSAKLALKFMNKNDRDEYEYEIPHIHGLEILKKCKHIVEKYRNSILIRGLSVDVDRYPNGLLVAEIEFTDTESAASFNPFKWLGEEITTDQKYSNIVLAKQNLTF